MTHALDEIKGDVKEIMHILQKHDTRIEAIERTIVALSALPKELSKLVDELSKSRESLIKQISKKDISARVSYFVCVSALVLSLLVLAIKNSGLNFTIGKDHLSITQAKDASK